MIKTSGTQIWCVVDGQLVEVGCVTSFQPPSKTYSTRDRTGLEDVIDRQEGGGRLSFGPINLTAIIKDEKMKAIFDGSTVRDWVVGLGDGTAQPTILNGVITMYKTRSWYYFDAIITSESHDALAPNEVLRGSYEGIVANYADYSIKSEDDDTTIQVPWQTNIPWQTDTYWR